MPDLVDLLRDHVGHTLTLIEPSPQRLALKCRSTNCTLYGRLIDVTSALGVRPRPGTASSQLVRRDPRPDEMCPAHIGEWREACRCCAAEAKALPDGATRPSDVRTGTDPGSVPEWQARRQALADRAAERRRRERDVTPSAATLKHDPTAEGSPA